MPGPGGAGPNRRYRTISTEQQFLITAKVGDRDLGIWDKMTGGDVTVAAAKHRAGGMGPEKSYRTMPTYADVVITRALERERDWEQLRWLQDHAGTQRMTVNKQPLDDDGNAWGTPMVYAGRLGPVKGGGADSGSNNVATYEVTMFCETRS
jgi:hypothetical protein